MQFLMYFEKTKPDKKFFKNQTQQWDDEYFSKNDNYENK